MMQWKFGKDTRQNKLQAYVEQLNNDLQNQLKKKKIRREKRRLKEYPGIFCDHTYSIVLHYCLCCHPFVFTIKGSRPEPEVLTTLNSGSTTS